MFSFILFFVLLTLVISFGLPFVKKGPPFAPTQHDAVFRSIRLADIQPGDRSVDIGSGDGRLVIMAARAGADAVGLEINPLLVEFSRWKIRRTEVKDKAKIIKTNFWNEDFGTYTVVTVFGVMGIMGKLEEKLLRELPAGARVVCNYFKFPNWQAVQSDGNIRLYIKK